MDAREYSDKINACFIIDLSLPIKANNSSPTERCKHQTVSTSWGFARGKASTTRGIAGGQASILG
jgi:hypothetical protein